MQRIKMQTQFVELSTDWGHWAMGRLCDLCVCDAASKQSADQCCQIVILIPGLICEL